jgi:hypothetical protein
VLPKVPATEQVEGGTRAGGDLIREREEVGIDVKDGSTMRDTDRLSE